MRRPCPFERWMEPPHTQATFCLVLFLSFVFSFFFFCFFFSVCVFVFLFLFVFTYGVFHSFIFLT